MNPALFVLLAILLMLALMAIGTPIAFAMALVGTLGLVLYCGFDTAMGVLSYYPYEFASRYTFSVLPLFILMGQIAFKAGLTRELFKFARAWLGQLPGGLAIGTIAGCALFAATCGSSLATAAAMGKIAIPEMRQANYSKQMASGCVAAGGTLGILIPPSIFLILYGIMTNTSIAKLLIAGFLPGILTAAMYMLAVFLRSLRNPELAPTVPGVFWKERIASIKRTWGMFIIVVIVLGGIYSGLATPTEAGALGAFGVMILGLVTRSLRSASLKEALSETVYSTATIFAIAIGAALMVPLVTVTNTPQMLAEAIIGLHIPRLLILLMFFSAFIILGMFVDALSLMLISLPVVFPAIIALGFDPIWFGVIMVKLIELALITPPVGMNLFVLKAITPADFSMADIYTGVWWFVVADICTLALLTFFPDIVLCLPNAMR